MDKFIEVHNTLINTKSIIRADFISDDIYLGLFPKNEKEEILVDYIPFTYASIELVIGEKIDLEIDLFPPEENEDIETWCSSNRAYINVSWSTLKEALKDITVVTGFEYKYGA